MLSPAARAARDWSRSPPASRLPAARTNDLQMEDVLEPPRVDVLAAAEQRAEEGYLGRCRRMLAECLSARVRQRRVRLATRHRHPVCYDLAQGGSDAPSDSHLPGRRSHHTTGPCVDRFGPNRLATLSCKAMRPGCGIRTNSRPCPGSGRAGRRSPGRCQAASSHRALRRHGSVPSRRDQPRRHRVLDEEPAWAAATGRISSARELRPTRGADMPVRSGSRSNLGGCQPSVSQATARKKQVPSLPANAG